MIKPIKLNKIQWKQFYKAAFDVKNVTFDDYQVSAVSGMMSYHAWILRGRIYVQFFLCNSCFKSAYFDIETFEYDWKFNDDQADLAREEQYAEWKENYERYVK